MGYGSSVINFDVAAFRWRDVRLLPERGGQIEGWAASFNRPHRWDQTCLRGGLAHGKRRRIRLYNGFGEAWMAPIPAH